STGVPAVLRDLRNETARLREYQIAPRVDERHERTHGPQHRSRTYCTDCLERFGPKIEYPEGERSLLERAQNDRRDPHGHWRRLVDEHDVEVLPSQLPPAADRGAEREG